MGNSCMAEVLWARSYIRYCNNWVQSEQKAKNSRYKFSYFRRTNYSELAPLSNGPY
jgi:hypothetical protein